MLYIILILLFTYINTTDINTCTCSQLLTKYDCENAITYQKNSQDYYQMKFCIWTDGTCEDINKYQSVQPCSEIPANYCSNVPFCSWYNNQCQSFTKCTDYTFEKSILSEQCQQLGCLNNGITCSFDTFGRTEEQNCEDIGDQEYCEYIYILYKSTLCVWNDNKCTGKKLTSCNDLTQQQCIQASSQCVWNTTCQQKTCQDGQYSIGQKEGITFCSSYIDISTNNTVYCSINDDGECQEVDPEDLDRRDCYAQSFQQYRWDPNEKSCSQC